jgi:dCMP deaminase
MKRDEYYMNIAIAVRDKANCLGRKVGAVLVKDNRIISTGYNGTPEGMTNCLDGGCVRCKNREKYKNSLGYDVCICVHAEQNALISAARFGTSVENSIAYSTMRPCFDCSKSLLQAKVKAIYYLHEWTHPVPELQEQYALIQEKFEGGVKKIEMTDPRHEWANNLLSKKNSSLPAAKRMTPRK